MRSGALSASQQILLVGFGNMGQALVRGWLANGRAASSIAIVDPVAAARAVAATLGVAAHEDGAAVAARADVVVLAVKPNQLTSALPKCAAAAARGAVLHSIAAGKTLDQIAAGLGFAAAVLRAMPNTP